MCAKVIYLYNIPTNNTYREILMQYYIYNLGKTQRVFKFSFFFNSRFYKFQTNVESQPRKRTYNYIKLKLVQKKRIEYSVIGDSYCWCENDATNINQDTINLN